MAIFVFIFVVLELNFGPGCQISNDVQINRERACAVHSARRLKLPAARAGIPCRSSPRAKRPKFGAATTEIEMLIQHEILVVPLENRLSLSESCDKTFLSSRYTKNPDLNVKNFWNTTRFLIPIFLTCTRKICNFSD